MRARLILIAAGLSVSATIAVAQPPRKPERASARPQSRAAEVVLASAEAVSAANPASAQPMTPAKRRIARVTTCRCGDPQPSPETQDQ